MADHISGEWVNQHGSVVTLELAPDGGLSGTFAAGAGFPSKKPVKVTGLCRADLVSFCADFHEHGSLTAWTGHIVDRDGGPTLELGWQMAVHVDESGTWKGLWTGHDQFTRTASRGPPLKSGHRPSHPTGRR